ncbi:unnamed protein product, partial [Musa acuminata var. zebrina]
MRDINWEAWKAGSKPKEEAMSDYLTKVKQLLEAAATAAYATLSHLALCSTVVSFELRCMRMSSFYI